jgi:carbon storage regulator
MLVLSRKPGERVVVPHLELALTVPAVEGKTVRLGFSAPEDLAVYREEVWRQRCQEAQDPAPEPVGVPEKSGPLHTDERKERQR